MPNVSWMRNELLYIINQYDLIRDCIKGEKAIKDATTKYLPMPNAADVSLENIARYNAYIARAVFYNTTQKTLYGLAGQVFTKDPVIKLPESLMSLNNDADGTNVNLTQLAKQCILKILAYGRSGILVDYPTMEVPLSKADLDNNDIKPIIKVYDPWQIINWRTIKRGAKKILSLVVLHEMFEEPKDEFEIELISQWRVLRLTDIGYEVSIYRKSGNRKKGLQGFEIVDGPFYPKDSNGNNINEIMFSFVGSESNDDKIDLPPLYDLSSLNVAHYRNSADYEESCFFVGQPTPVLAGLSEQWVHEVLKDRVVLGSRSAIPLPVGGTAELLQAQPNSMPYEAMTAKEKQMVALGAKLVEEKVIERTATEANIDKSAEDSILVSSAKNVTMAFQWALEKAALFVGAVNDSIKFHLHTDFHIARMSAQDRAELIAEMQGGAISFTETREVLRKNGIATQEDVEAKKEIDEYLKKQAALNKKQIINKASNKATGTSGS